MEAADSNTKAFKSTEPAIHQFTRKASKSCEKVTCYRCDRSDHSPAECKFREATCHHCQKKGHIAPVCHSKARQQQPPPSQAKSTGGHKQRHRRAHHVHEEASIAASDTDASSGDEYHLNKLDDRSSHPITVQVLVNERPLTMELEAPQSLSSRRRLASHFSTI